ncbi:MAG: AEC family transporter, partial [Clostridiales bacterium]|nr:AEC family transporter [Clostridiales bacterium]
MDDLLFSLNTVFPLLVMMAVGFTARRVGVIGESAARQINACVFKIFLPLLLCFNIVDTQLGASTDVRTLLYAFVTTLLCFGTLFVITPRLCRDRASCGVLIQGIARSNYAIFGIPLVMMMYPEGDTSIAVLMVAVVVPVFNVLSTVALMVFGGEKGSPWRIVKGVLLNPLILGTLAGFLLWYFQIPIPSLIETPLRNLGSIATPLALFVLGASLDFSKARANIKLLVISVTGRLVV